MLEFCVMCAEIHLKLTTVCALIVYQGQLHWLTFVGSASVLCMHAICTYGLLHKCLEIGPTGTNSPHHTIFYVLIKEKNDEYLR